MTDKRTYDLTTQATLDTDAFFVIDKSGWATARRIQCSILSREGGVVFNESAADVDFRVESDTESKMFFVDGGTNRVGIRTDAPLATLHVDQAGAGAGIPALYLDQADIDLEFIKFVGSSEDGEADRSLVDAADMTTPGALTGWIQIYVEDVQGTNPITDGVYYIPFYAAPSA